MKKRNWLCVTILAVSLLFLSACGSSSSQGGDNGKDIINLMSASEMTTLDTTAMKDFPDAVGQTAAFEGLYVLDKEDKIVPGLAKELPEISQDGQTYTINMREDGRWSNGDKVTAHDFIYAWKKLADGKNARYYNFLVQQTILNGEAVAKGEKSPEELGVKAIDDYTIEIQLVNAKPYFTSVLAFPTFFPQNEKFEKEKGEKYGLTSEDTVYNGPFIVKNWKQGGQNWDFEKNPEYRDKENVKSDQIHYEVIKESSTASNLFEDGQLDMAIISGAIAAQSKDNPAYQAKPTGIINYIRLNQKREDKDTPLANENVRKALAAGLNKETIVEKFASDDSKILNGAIPANFVSNPETGEDFRKEVGEVMTYDKAAALNYWKAAQAELGETIEIELLVNDDEAYKKMAEGIQAELQNTLSGLKINVKSLPTETALDTARKSDYDMFLIYWAPDYQDPSSTLNMLHSPNDRNYSDPKYDQMLDDAAVTLATDPEKRWQKLIEAEKYALEDTAGMIVISQRMDAVLQNPDLKGIEYHTFAAPITLKEVYKEK